MGPSPFMAGALHPSLLQHNHRCFPTVTCADLYEACGTTETLRLAFYTYLSSRGSPPFPQLLVFPPSLQLLVPADISHTEDSPWGSVHIP